eukprot:GHUV01040423.1.p1 GENE.GHUV01040423.1~~GHUV01040423.1.p1  ORF type:complete len:112 (+),score=18.75 GHUV01040423.1:544-879(+)
MMINWSHLKNVSNFFLPSSSRLPPTPQIRLNRNHNSTICEKASSPSSRCKPLSLVARASKRLVNVRTELKRSIGTSSLHSSPSAARVEHAMAACCLKASQSNNRPKGQGPL